jgi:hypothetical protein
MGRKEVIQMAAKYHVRPAGALDVANAYRNQREYAKAHDFRALEELSPFAQLLAKELHVGVENAEFVRTAMANGVKPLARK